MLFKIILVALISKFVASAAAQAVQTVYRTPIEKGYKLEYFYKANWTNAYLFCRYHGLQLATIETKEQQDYVKQIIVDNGLAKEFFWVSGQDQDREGRFSWFSTGNNLKYSNWDVGQPDNYQGNENCLQLWTDQKWNDVLCSLQYYFICEKPEGTINCNRECGCN